MNGCCNTSNEMRMKKYLTLLVAIGCMANAYAQPKMSDRFTLHNAGTTVWKEKVVSIPWEGFRERFRITDTSGFRVVDIRTGREVPLQLERLGGREPVSPPVAVPNIAVRGSPGRP